MHDLPTAPFQIGKVSCPINTPGPRPQSKWGQITVRDLGPLTHPRLPQLPSKLGCSIRSNRTSRILIPIAAVSSLARMPPQTPRQPPRTPRHILYTQCCRCGSHSRQMAPQARWHSSASPIFGATAVDVRPIHVCPRRLHPLRVVPNTACLSRRCIPVYTGPCILALWPFTSLPALLPTHTINL